MPIDEDPISALRTLQGEMDKLFADLFGRRPTSPRAAFTPLSDVYHIKGSDTTIVKVELPGIRMEELNILIDGRTLIIQGIRHDPNCRDKVYQQIEIDHGPFERKIVLPNEVDEKSSKATYENGFLFIELPVHKREKSAVKIQIKVKED